jgi:hypothetical protein
MKTLTLAALAWLALADGVQAMDGVKEQVLVITRAGKVLVQLSVDNASARAIHVPRALYGDKELFHAAFAISSDGVKIDYIGAMVKRGPLTGDDFLAVKPGARRSNAIDISRSYGFLPGTHTYQLHYGGSYLSGIAKPLPATSASFTYTKKGTDP